MTLGTHPQFVLTYNETPLIVGSREELENFIAANTDPEDSHEAYAVYELSERYGLWKDRRTGSYSFWDGG